MPKKSEIQIFLAHANEDKKVVLELYDRLKRAGYKPWLDKKDLIAGQNWRSVIPEAIAQSQLFIACLSSRSIAKQGFVQREFKTALSYAADRPPSSIYIIPLRFDECEIPNLRQDEYGLNLRDLHWLDYWEVDGFDNLEKEIAYQYGPFTQDQSFTQDLGDGIKLEMIAIPGGTFMMGSSEAEGSEYEKPQHKVTVQPFFMGKYPVTQAQWRAIASLPKVESDLEANPSYFKGDNLPVETISWDDAKEFCNRLSKKTQKEYRLPTEAEWEYACRGRTTTPFHFGETISTDLANYRGTEWEFDDKVYPGNYGSGSKGIFREQTTTVEYFKVANAFGLYDMHGNVWEWCQDDWHNNYHGAPTDGRARVLDGNNTKAIRGGSWFNDPLLCRSAFRYNNSRDNRDDDIGFRVVCVVSRTT